MVEDTEEHDGNVEFHAPVNHGWNVHAPGLGPHPRTDSLRTGNGARSTGDWHAGNHGPRQCLCVSSTTVSMLATGDELVEPWEEPPYGAIRDSNGYAVLARRRKRR